jgi:hypothetical protein
MSNLQFIKKETRGYKIGSVYYTKADMQLAVLEYNLIMKEL